MFIQWKFNQNPLAMEALILTECYELVHNVGEESPNTSLPKDEFINILKDIRQNELAIRRKQNLVQRLRFEGPVPIGRLQFTCCGYQEFDKIIVGGKETEKYKCSKCGKIFIITEHEDHWHLNIMDEQRSDTKINTNFFSTSKMAKIGIIVNM